MYRRIDNHNSTASYNHRTKRITVMCDDGWEDIIDYWTS